MVHRILIFARHYPPLVSGGARRPWLLATALRDLGVETFIVAPKLADNEPGIAVAHPMPEPQLDLKEHQTGFRDRLRSLLLWPDADILWAQRATKAALSAEFQPDWVITTSPPESLHAAGFALKQKLHCRWAADFRDSWLVDPLISARNYPLRRSIEEAIARRWLAQADITVTATESIMREISKLTTARTVHLPQFAEPACVDYKFYGGVSIVHTGSFSLSDPSRSIEPALEAFEAASTEPSGPHLHLAGRLTHEERARLSASSAAARITYHGIVDYKTARRMQAGATALLLVTAPGATAIPGKLSEYRSVGKPIIVVGDGPWREEAGLPYRDPVSEIHLASKGKLRSKFQPSPSPEKSAKFLLELMAEAEQ